MDDSEPFHKLLPTQDPLYKEYRKLNPKAISFETVHKRLHKKPSSHYKGYKEFAQDVAQIFAQEKRLKNYKGANKEAAAKRLAIAKRVENYWNNLIAPYERYGFEAVINNKNKDSDDNEQQDEDDHKNIIEEESTPKRPQATTESKQDEQTRKTLSNLKKRVKRGEETPATVDNKRRRLNDYSGITINTQDTTASIGHEDDEVFQQASHSDEFSEVKDDEKLRDDDNEEEDDDVDLLQDVYPKHDHNHNYRHALDDDVTDNEQPKNGHMFADTVFTPFADKSRVFRKNYNAQELFSGNQSNQAIKKTLLFEEPFEAQRERVKFAEPAPPRSEHKQFKFRIRYTYTKNGESSIIVEAPQMDAAVRRFRETHKTCKILTAELQL